MFQAATLKSSKIPVWLGDCDTHSLSVIVAYQHDEESGASSLIRNNEIAFKLRSSLIESFYSHKLILRICTSVGSNGIPAQMLYGAPFNVLLTATTSLVLVPYRMHIVNSIVPDHRYSHNTHCLSSISTFPIPPADPDTNFQQIFFVWSNFIEHFRRTMTLQQKGQKSIEEIESKKHPTGPNLRKKEWIKKLTTSSSSLPNSLRTLLASIPLNLPFPSPFKAFTNASFPFLPWLARVISSSWTGRLLVTPSLFLVHPRGPWRRDDVGWN